MRRFLLPLLGLIVLTAGFWAGSAQGRLLPVPSRLRSSSSSVRSIRSSSSASMTPVSSDAVRFSPQPGTAASVRIPILVYHHLRATKGYPKTTWSWKMSVTPSVFGKQMQWIADHGYTTISLDTFAKIFRGEIAGPAKPVVITFDDNNLNVYESGFPVLKKLGLTATWYLIANRIDRKTFLSTAQVQELSSAGMDIQSHSVTHSWMTSLTPEKQKWELTESRRILEGITGKPVAHLAYPLTMQNAALRKVVAEQGYVTATIMDPRPATQKDDLLKLPRIMMTDDAVLAKVLP